MTNFDLEKYKKLTEGYNNETLSKEEVLELYRYQNFIVSQAQYDHRLEYKNLLIQFLEKKIDVIDFARQFMKFDDKVTEIAEGFLRDFEFLKSFQMNLNSKNFGDLIFEIYEICFAICDEGEFFDESNEASPRLYDLIQERFLQLEKID